MMFEDKGKIVVYNYIMLDLFFGQFVCLVYEEFFRNYNIFSFLIDLKLEIESIVYNFLFKFVE